MAEKLPNGLRDFLDYPTTRKKIFDGAIKGLTERYPIENNKYRLELADLKYEGPEKFSLAEQKKAILQRRSLSRNLTGTWRLTDKETNQAVDQRRTSVVRVPYLTSRGTYIVNGSEYSISNQMRLRSGVYTRAKENGDYEAHFNILKGGPSFRVHMEPKTGIFRMNVGQANLRLYPILRSMGMSDAQLVKLWGPDLYAANQKQSERGEGTLSKAWARLANARARKETGDKPKPDSFLHLLQEFKLDPDVTEQTLGKRYDSVTPEVMMRTMQKLINVSKQEEDTDDRDSLAFQDTHSAEDFFKERLVKDAGRKAHRALWKATLRNSLSGMLPGELTPQMESVFFKSGVAQPLEEINTVDALDQNLRVIRMGEGGIPSQQAVPVAARSVQPSHFTYIDPIRSPESGSVGVDARIATETYKGADKTLYSKLLDARTGKTAYLPPKILTNSIVAFPGELQLARKEGRRKVRAMRNGRIEYVDASKVDYVPPSAQSLFTAGSNLVPLFSATKGGRLLMGAKMAAQALPLRHGEAPLVQSATPRGDGSSYEGDIGKYSGVVKSDVAGVVTKVNKNDIIVTTSEGPKTYELYNNFPTNRKTYLTSFPKVKPGDAIKPGQLLATSNMTDKEGTLAIGKNLRVGYLPYRGLNFEDAIVISESTANKLSSEHMYTKKMDIDDFTAVDRDKFRVMYPQAYTAAQVKKVGEDGVIQEGQTVEEGDPLILSITRQTSKGAGMLHRGSKQSFRDNSLTWDHEHPGVVTDVWRDKSGVKVAVRSYAPMEEGDKLSGRMGDKNIVSKVIPDDQMPLAEDGKPLEVIANPLGVISRVNPNQMIEAVLGKIAAKTGKPYKTDSFTDEDMVELAIKELEVNGMKDTEDLFDPDTNRTIPKVFTGNRFFMKLHHMAAAKTSGRALGGYSMEGVPSQTPGKKDAPKRVGSGEMQALVSHGAIENIRDIKTTRGQRNDDYWKAMTMGHRPPTPEVPAAYKKFMTLLKGAGINVNKKGNQLHLTAMTDTDVTNMASGEITKPTTVKWQDEYKKGTFGEQSMEPSEGGLFDRGITGGHGGNKWSFISIAPMPQPAMEDPIRRMLNLTQKEFRGVLAGTHQIQTGTGPKAMHEALKRLKVGDEIERMRDEVKNGTSMTRRDSAVKRLKYLTTLQKQGTKPSDLMVTKVPVIPPIFRPITATRDFVMVSDSNKLYMQLMRANESLKEMEGVVEGDVLGDARLNLYDAFKAITGLGDPVGTRTDEVKARGLLKEVFGSSPKYGLFQRKLLATPVDLAARAAITPNPDLDMDQIGIPEDKAWDLYAPFVMRRLIKKMGGIPSARAQAIKMVSERSPRAVDTLIEEMKERPVLASRAPALHRYSMMAFQPVLHPGKSLQLSPSIVTGFNADFDGNCVIFDTEINVRLSKSALDSLQSSGYLITDDATPVNKEQHMRTVRTSAVVVKSDGGAEVLMEIGDMPRIGVPIQDKNGADVYDLPAGMSVLSYDHTIGKQLYAPITKLTVEQGAACEKVKTASREVTVSNNESMCVFDHATGELSKVTPQDAKGKFAPVLHAAAEEYGTYGDRDLGWFVGAFVSDGWLSGSTEGTVRTVGYSKIEEHKRDEFVRIARSHVNENFLVRTYSRAAGDDDGYGANGKIHCNGPDFAKAVAAMDLSTPGSKDVRQALTKRIPAQMILDGSEEFLWGLVSGLLDGDGSVTCNMKTGRPRYGARFSTSSPRLKVSLGVLFQRLGIRHNVTTTPPRGKSNESYTISMSTVDTFKILSKLSCIGARERELVAEWKGNPPDERTTKEVVPVTLKEVEIVAPLARLHNRSGIYTALKRNKVTPRLNKATLLGFIAQMRNEGSQGDDFKPDVVEADALQALYTRAASDVVWEAVKSVEPAETQEVFDLAVEGTKVFAVNNGLIIYDTMNFHVVVSDKAVQEAKDKLLPSRNLRSPADFATMWSPRQEFLQGLYLASTKKSGRKMLPKFDSMADVIAAYKRGEVSIEDVVSIKD